MPKSIAAFFLLVYLMGATELHELFKLPLLVEHFWEHQQQQSTTNIWDFLTLHYANNPIPDEDRAKDQQLPFKEPVCCHGLSSCYFLSTHCFEWQQPLAFYIIPINYYDDSPHSTAYLANIWQPPQA